MNAYNLYHGGSEIKKINPSYSHFDTFLFFSDCKEAASSHCHDTLYKIDASKLDIIEAGQLFYHDDAERLEPFIDDVVEIASCDREQAERYLEESDAYNPEGDPYSTAGWEIQSLTAQCARTLGFDGVAVADEHGTSYMICMKNREDKLLKIED